MEYININQDFKFETYKTSINIYSKVDGRYKYYDTIFSKQQLTEENFIYMCKSWYFEQFLKQKI